MTFTVTLLIIIITCLVSYKGFTDRAFFEQLKHHPVSESKNGEWYRMISSGFLHADWLHLGINMYVLYQFGTFVESMFLAEYGQVLGRTIYLILYIAMIIIADIPSLIKHKDNQYYGAIGASGAVSGILFIFILYAPWSMLRLYFAIPIPAIIFGVLYLGYSSWASKNSNDNIGHDAHFFGAVAGIVIALLALPWLFPHFLEAVMAGPK